MIRSINAGSLNIAYVEEGEPGGWPVVLLHGFPYDIHAYTEVSKILAAAGARVIVPYLRGFGATRFVSSATPRSGQQAALGADVLALLDALSIPAAILAGYDWGGRGACVVSALWPERVTGLVSCGSYNIHDIAGALTPDTPDNEHRLWYQYYFHSERGRAGLAKDAASFCRLLWQLWSPTWAFDDAVFAKTAPAFDNPDFVDVVIHSYRQRYGLVEGDPAFEAIEAQLARRPDIGVPAITIDGGDDGIRPAGSASHAKRFKGPHEHRVIPGAGHNVPQEAPQAFADAIIALAERSAR
ncbi:alpha/beta fold hydrolase [Paraburkholderia sp. BCC1885]|uniref:alpha/beta fold hydrolase n=1 Tax=Paraburkholderia sp. BCC1885 TaxID=2562669 RepID=UPI0011820626|nr:alpha/beta hydrolase [Paraburkholderia sp. BCC1885]